MAAMLTGEEKQRIANLERGIMKLLMTSAMTDNPTLLSSTIESYTIFDHDQGSKPFQVLSQFKDGRGRTPLHFASQNFAVSVLLEIVSLVKSKTELMKLFNIRDEQNQTPLMLACHAWLAAPDKITTEQKEKFVNMLLLNKASITHKNNINAQAIHYAVSSNCSPSIVEKLISANTVNSATSAGTPLHWALMNNTPNVIKNIGLLLLGGGDVNKKREDGISPVVIAVASESDAAAALLIDANCDVGVLLGGNISIMHIAADNNLTLSLTSLMNREEGRRLAEIKNDNQETPIMLAAGHDYVEAVRILMGGSSGASLEDAKNQIVEILKVAPAKTEKPSVSDADPDAADPDAEPAEVPNPDAPIFAEIDIILAKEKENSTSEANKAAAAGFKSQGNTYFSNNDYKLAIEEYTKAIELYPVDKTYYSNRSACYMATDDAKSSLRDAIFARSCDKEWPKACYRLAVARLAVGRHEDAALAAWEGVQLDDQNEELKTIMQRAVKKGRSQHQKANNK